MRRLSRITLITSSAVHKAVGAPQLRDLGGAGESNPGRRHRLQEAKPALDDLEPWSAGSFDEIVLACDLDVFSDQNYAALVEAIKP